MVKRIALLGIAAFCLFAAGMAVAQSKTPVAKSMIRVTPNEPGAGKQRQPVDAARSLPDAPSAQVPYSAEILKKVSEGSHLPLAATALAKPALGRELLPRMVLPEAPSASVLFRAVPEKKDSSDFLAKYLNLSHPQQNSPFQPLSNGKVMARATDAASRVFLMRDPTGRAHVNTRYFLRVLTSVAAENASRRYRARSGTAPLTDFGSTVGNDAGMNLLHEFAPGIRQKMSGHVPEIVSRIGQHFSHTNAR